MRSEFLSKTVCLYICVGALLGCKKAPEVKTVGVAEVPGAIHDAFHDASGEVQTEAAELEAAAKQQDPSAVSSLVQLMRRPDVTQEERAAAARCLPPLLDAARKAAAQGDAKAAQALNDYQVSK